MSEDLKEYLSTISRPTHIASETELSLYKVSTSTRVIKVQVRFHFRSVHM